MKLKRDSRINRLNLIIPFGIIGFSICLLHLIPTRALAFGTSEEYSSEEEDSPLPVYKLKGAADGHLQKPLPGMGVKFGLAKESLKGNWPNGKRIEDDVSFHGSLTHSVMNMFGLSLPGSRSLSNGEGAMQLLPSALNKTDSKIIPPNSNVTKTLTSANTSARAGISGI